MEITRDARVYRALLEQELEEVEGRVDLEVRIRGWMDMVERAGGDAYGE